MFVKLKGTGFDALQNRAETAFQKLLLHSFSVTWNLKSGNFVFCSTLYIDVHIYHLNALFIQELVSVFVCVCVNDTR